MVRYHREFDDRRLGNIAGPPEMAFDTRLYVPGFGCGTVEDRGPKIRGAHIDLWFPTPQVAGINLARICWGQRENVKIEVCDDK
jgi:3D (Asp-Asp-Asp) domain-containing protein